MSRRPTIIRDDDLTAAALCARVYHAKSASPPPENLVALTYDYSARTGFYAEAWGQRDPEDPSRLERIFLVCRGTVAQRPVEGGLFPDVDLKKSYRSDQLRNIVADIRIALGMKSALLDDGVKFYNHLKRQFGNINIVPVGHSLGGAVANHILAQTQGDEDRCRQAITFNALPYQFNLKAIPDKKRVVAISHKTINYRIATDYLTRNPLLRIAARLLRRQTAGRDVLLPAGTANSFVARVVTSHGISTVMESLSDVHSRQRQLGIRPIDPNWVAQLTKQTTAPQAGSADKLKDLAAATKCNAATRHRAALGPAAC